MSSGAVPGPWHVGGLVPIDESGELARVVFSDVAPVAFVSPAAGDDLGARDATAALVAAAPALLDACRLALVHLDASRGSGEGGVLRAKLEAAIAAAEGGR